MALAAGKPQVKSPAKTPAQVPAKSGVGTGGKSGLVVLEAGQDLFKEGDTADCLFIIQKGQIRLYKPKGKGFIELAVLRSGEVLGEMAYFGDGNDGRRSCSASAISKTEVIAVSFIAFGKAIENLNPWFKTIITTLADRLRKANLRIKELESNSVSVSGGAAATYEFLKDAEISKIMSMLYLTAKGLGTREEKGGVVLSKKIFSFYASDIFAQSESKYEEFFQFLNERGVIELKTDQDNIPNIISIRDVEKIKSLFTFVNTQRGLKDEKKFHINSKCEQLMDAILNDIKEKKLEGPKVTIDLGPIVGYFKERNLPIDVSDLEGARQSNMIGEISIGSGGVYMVDVNKALVDSNWDAIKFSNALKKWNERKSGK